jgi:hypothetical protein
MNDDDHVLRDVLQELDRERCQRAELQAKVRQLEVQVSQQSPSSLEAQVEGYRRLVDALTQDRPAICAAAETTESLPVHVVRLLELMPWDASTIPHRLVTETAYEWQVYDQGVWQSSAAQLLKHKLLQPLISRCDATSRRGCNGSLGLWTNGTMSSLLHHLDSNSLPSAGSWEWINEWTIDKRMTNEWHPEEEMTLPRRKVDCDEQGWSYVAEALHFVTRPTEWAYDQASDNNDIRRIRRRKWMRQRALVDYPHASDRTRHYLRLAAQLEQTRVRAARTEQRLVETKMAATRAQQAWIEQRQAKDHEIAALRQQVEQLKSNSSITPTRPAKLAPSWSWGIRSALHKSATN